MSPMFYILLSTLLITNNFMLICYIVVDSQAIMETLEA